MENNEAFGWVDIGEPERIPLTRETVSIFRHLGAAAVYDHVFLALGTDRGMYFWRDTPAHDLVTEAAINAECVTHLNLQRASEVDIKAYITHHTDDSNDCPDWLPEV